MSSLAGSKRRSGILVIGGDQYSLTSLFTSVSQQLESNKAYSKSKNRIELSATSVESNQHVLNVETKYYDVQLDVETVFNEADFLNRVDRLLEDHQVEALFIFTANQGWQPARNVIKHQKWSQLTNDSSLLKILITSPNEDAFDCLLGDESLDDFVTIKLDISKETNGVLIDQSLETPNDDEDEDDEDYSDLDELINAIFVHPWQSMQMKGESSSRRQETTSAFNAIAGVTAASSVAAAIDQSDPKEDDQNETENDGDHNKDTEDAFDFEHLMMNLHDIRSKASGMTFDERKKYAENVVMNFWRSMGGDEDEINGLDDDEDDNDD
jgi:hypothetical protein